MPTEVPSDSGQGRYFCPHCAQPIDWVLPVEPVYDTKVAAWLIPTTWDKLRRHLWRHKDKYPKLYRKTSDGKLRRVLRARDIRRLRRYFLKQKDQNGLYIDLSDYGQFRKDREGRHQKTSPLTFQLAEGDLDVLDGVVACDPSA